MEKVTLKNVDEAYVHVDATTGILWEIRDQFAYRPPGFQFMPAYRNKLWDGYIRLLDSRSQKMPRGLTPQLIDWCKGRGYEVEYPDEEGDSNISLAEAEEFVASVNPSKMPRDYQMDGFVHAMRARRRIIVSPTGSGKSLLQYLMFMYLMKKGMRGLLIVPRAALVEQMYSDFQDYSSKNGKDMEKYCHRIYSGKDKHSDKPLVISTWQSLANMPPSFFKQFQYVIVDEVHGAAENKATAKIVSKIVSYMTNASYRIGVTGTLPTDFGSVLSLVGLFGEPYKVISSAELMQRKQLAELNIKCLLLKYTEEECRYMTKQAYKDEMNYIIGHTTRNQFIVNLALSLKGNTLLLFNYVEKQGDVIYEMLKTKAGDTRKVFYIHGGTNVNEREEIRRIVENEQDAIIVGSVGVLSTGTNIVSLSNIIFASPSKSKIRNLQSIGRALRVSDSKQSACLFDIADDFRWKRNENYTLRHFFERIKTYGEEGFAFKIYKIEINP